MDESEEMVRLLLGGARMLKHHCPSCNLPLFGKDGGVVCVRCGVVKVINEGEGVGKERSVGGPDPVDVGLDEDVRSVLLKKRGHLLSQLEIEEDPVRIVSLLDAISKIEASLKGY